MTKTKGKSRVLKILLILMVCSALLLGLVLRLSLPYMQEAPLDEDPDHLHLTDEPTAEPTAPPIYVEIPEPEANPYGRNDFQFDGRYLKNLRCNSIPGVDVSAYQGDINWNQVAVSGIKFAMIRVGYRAMVPARSWKMTMPGKISGMPFTQDWKWVYTSSPRR